MKSAQIVERRTRTDGSRIVRVLCPVCGYRHSFVDTDTTVACPRRARNFVIGGRRP